MKMNKGKIETTGIDIKLIIAACGAELMDV